MTITKKLILNIVLVIWIIFSVIYIFYDVWSDFKLKALNQAYQQGRADTINALIQQAGTCGNWCQIYFLFLIFFDILW